MKLEVIRQPSSSKSTIGELLIDNNHECWTLEDVMRPLGVKVQNQTAIPCGTYEVIINWSDRFQRPMPLLLNVQGFEGVRIHWGNTDVDTDGCILLGLDKGQDFIGRSRDAFSLFFIKLQSALNTGKVFITLSLNT